MLDRGDVFAGYRIEGALGRGGMGAVYLARRPGMPRAVALKLLNPDVSADPEIRARFEDEAEVVARLHHPGIVAVYDSGIDDARLWMAMQYVDGRDATVVSPHSLPPERVIALAGSTAAALDYAHHAGVLHRDVKPANILLARPTRTSPEAALLTDFGIARLRDEPGCPTPTGTVLATLAYAAPEQLRGLPLDHRSDQYSLACTLFRMLTGTLPHAATNPAAMIKGHLHDPPHPVATLRPDLPTTLDKVMTRALAKQPTDRYPTCTDFIAAIRQAFTGTKHPRTLAEFPAPDVAPPVSEWRPSATDSHPSNAASDLPAPSSQRALPVGNQRLDDESPTTRIPITAELSAAATFPAVSAERRSPGESSVPVWVGASQPREEFGALRVPLFDETVSAAGGLPPSIVTSSTEAGASSDESNSIGRSDMRWSLDEFQTTDEFESPTARIGLAAEELAFSVAFESSDEELSPEKRPHLIPASAQLSASTPLGSEALLPKESRPLGTGVPRMKVVPRVVSAEEIRSPAVSRPPSRQRTTAAYRSRWGYIAIILAALLIVLISIFG
ncbi:serine/threonine-protein kinase [Nocardia goodfellowii]|uniref:non-specific serine/threonine protein kinase n=1 Tax=Nocardia goodfellowii TaxID=882446 RepID=A0ABS4QQ80_9NOCA|nr:serine/threonine-protein kinase [Nocardia goodfellowii]MBP2193866.1 serine/threonine protein kinase [Nocardia goodfellowii]